MRDISRPKREEEQTDNENLKFGPNMGYTQKGNAMFLEGLDFYYDQKYKTKKDMEKRWEIILDD